MSTSLSTTNTYYYTNPPLPFPPAPLHLTHPLIMQHPFCILDNIILEEEITKSPRIRLRVRGQLLFEVFPRFRQRLASPSHHEIRQRLRCRRPGMSHLLEQAQPLFDFRPSPVHSSQQHPQRRGVLNRHRRALPVHGEHEVRGITDEDGLALHEARDARPETLVVDFDVCAFLQQREKGWVEVLGGAEAIRYRCWVIPAFDVFLVWLG